MKPARRLRTVVPAALAVVLAAAFAACGDDDATTTEVAFDPKAEIVVAAPTSLQPAFDAISAADELDTHMFFSGSDFHADKIRDGELPDLLAADSQVVTDGLLDEGLISDPLPIATDELVVAVPEDSEIESLEDLAGEEVRIAIGQEGLPSGDYAREAIAGLPEAEAQAILANVTEETPNNNAIGIALDDGKADAGFVYASDVEARNELGGKLRAIELPPDLRPEVVYTAAVVSGSENPAGAQRFLDSLLTGAGAAELEKSGLGPPPG